MTSIIKPAVWLIILIVGIPQLSETVYSPSLPDIAQALKVSEAAVEHTLSIYLLAFAIGSLFWGKLSDSSGRKSSMIAGFIVFALGCIICYLSTSIETLMLGRFVQAFGGSVGSVLGQAVCRDSFEGPDLGKIYAIIGACLGLFPAIGPLIGGMIAEYHGWNNIFLFLIFVTIFVTIMIIFYLPETHLKENRNKTSLLKLVLILLKDKKVIGFGLIIGGCNGISFSYYAEGSFYLIDLLGLSPSQYGITFILIALSLFIAAITSKYLHKNHAPVKIMEYGLKLMFLSALIFSLFIFINFIYEMPNQLLIFITLISQMLTMFGFSMAVSNALASALVDYKHCIGSASSLLGFFYYTIISVITYVMGLLHNGTLLPMPLYFLVICILMLVIRKALLYRN